MKVFIDGRGTLASETVAAAFVSKGHTVLRPEVAFGKTMGCEALQMLALKADLIVLDAMPSLEAEPPSTASQVGILSALRHTPYVSKKKLMLLSTVQTWAKLIVADGVTAAERHYEKRAPFAGYIELKALEDEAIRMRSSRLDVTVLGCGILTGLGEDLLFPMLREAWLQQPVTVPSLYGGMNVLPTLLASDLAKFVLELALATEGFPKPYLLAVNARHQGSLLAVASAISRVLGTGEVGYLEGEDYTTELMDGPGSVAPLQLDMRFSMADSIFEALVPQAVGEFNETMAAYDASSPVQPGFGAAAATVVSEFLAFRGLKPLKFCVAGPAGLSTVEPGGDGDAMAAAIAGSGTQLASILSARYKLPTVTAAAAVDFVRSEGKILFEQKKAEEAEAAAAAAAAAAEAAAAEAAAEDGVEASEEVKDGEEKTEEEGKAEEIVEDEDAEARRIFEAEVEGASAATLVPAFDDLELYSLVSAPLGEDGVTPTGEEPPLEDIERSVQVRCVRAMLRSERLCSLYGYVLGPGGGGGGGGGGGFFFASKDEAKELFAVKKFEPKTAGEGEDQGVDAPTEAAAKVEADNPAESASEEEGKTEEKEEEEEDVEWDAEVLPSRVVLLDASDSFLSALELGRVNEKAQAEAAAAKEADPTAEVAAEPERTTEIPEAFTVALSAYRDAVKNGWGAPLPPSEAGNEGGEVTGEANDGGEASEGKDDAGEKELLSSGLLGLFGAAVDLVTVDVGKEVLSKMGDRGGNEEEAVEEKVNDSEMNDNTEDPTEEEKNPTGDEKKEEQLIVSVADASAVVESVAKNLSSLGPLYLRSSAADEGATVFLRAALQLDAPADPTSSSSSSSPSPATAEAAQPSASTGSEEKTSGTDSEPARIGVVKMTGVSPEELKELEERSQLFRNYLMANVMPVLTQGMLQTMDTSPKDPIEFLSDYLIRQGELAEQRAEAQAFLQFKALIAKAKWLEALEKAEEAAAAEAAANDDDDDED